MWLGSWVFKGIMGRHRTGLDVAGIFVVHGLKYPFAVACFGFVYTIILHRYREKDIEDCQDM